MENAVVNKQKHGNCVTVKLYRIPKCSLCDKMEKDLKKFNPVIYDCSKHKNRKIMEGVKKITDKWFKYPLVVIQYEDLALMISGYYSEMINDIKKTIREMRK